MYKVSFEDYISVKDEKGEEVLHIEYDSDMESVIEWIDSFIERLNKKESGYVFNIPVGDWSDDGHGKCEYFTVKSNKPVEEVREIHFQIKEVTGFDIDNFCRKYGDDCCDEDNYALLKELGFDFANADLDDDEDNAVIYPKGFAEIWAFLLMKTDNNLKLEFINSDIANLSFYGFDEKGRHISASGYGCFY